MPFLPSGEKKIFLDAITMPASVRTAGAFLKDLESVKDDVTSQVSLFDPKGPISKDFGAMNEGQEWAPAAARGDINFDFCPSTTRRPPAHAQVCSRGAWALAPPRAACGASRPDRGITQPC